MRTIFAYTRQLATGQGQGEDVLNQSMESDSLDGNNPSLSVWVTRLVLVLLAGSLAAKIYLVVSGQWDVGPGDSAQRIRLALHASLHDRLFTTKFFTDVWPHLPEIMQGGMLNFLRATPFGEHVDYVKACLILSATLFTLGCYFVFLSIRRLSNATGGAFAVLALLGNELMNLGSVSGYVNGYAFFFVAAGSWVLLMGHARYRWVFVAALLMQAAALCRTDAVVLSAIYTCVLFYRKPRLRAVLFGSVAGLFFFVKPFALMALGRKATIFGSTQSAYNFETDRSVLFDMLVEMWRTVLSSSDGVMLAYGLLGVVALAFSRKARLLPLVFSIFSTIVFVVCVTGIVSAYQPRYFYIPIVLLYMAAGALHGRVFEFAWKIPSIRLRYVSSALLVAVFIVFNAIQIFQLSDRRIAPQYTTMRLAEPEGVRETYEWLSTQLVKEDTLHFDYLNNWGQYLHAKTDALNLDRHSFNYSGSPPMRYKGEIPDLKDDNALKTTFRAHTHIVGYEPRYYVGLSETEYARIENVQWVAKHKRSSYIRPYLEEVESSGVYAFNSEFFDHIPIYFRPVHETSYLEVYEILYDPRDPELVVDRERVEKELRDYRQTMKRLEDRFAHSTEEQPPAHEIGQESEAENLEDRFGFSSPRISNGRILHLGETDLYVHGWYASSERRTLRVQLNEEEVPVRYGLRGDIEKNFPDYRYRTGWTARIPHSTLRRKNTLIVFIDDHRKMAVQIKLPD